MAQAQSAVSVDDGGVASFRIPWSGAQRVQVDIADVALVDLVPEAQADGDTLWVGSSPALTPGFHYIAMLADDEIRLIPDEPTFYGYGRITNAVEVKVPGRDNWEESSILPDGITPVKHGRVVYDRYFSEVTGNWRPIAVYLPPSASSGAALPVMYIQHGTGENETSWMKQGRVPQIMDNLASQGLCREMILVSVDSQLYPIDWDKGVYDPESMALFEKDLLGCVIPYVESHYPAATDRGSRYMCGLSLGAGQTLYIGLAHPELFSAAGVFSAGVFGGMTAKGPQFSFREALGWIYDEPARFNNAFPVFYISCGEQDRRCEFNRSAVEELRSHGINVRFETFEGAHEWRVWRDSLESFLIQLQ